MKSCNTLHVIPVPKHMSEPGELYPHTGGIVCECPEWTVSIPPFVHNLEQTAGVSANSETGIVLKKDPGLTEEAYTVHADQTCVVLTAGGLSSINHALSALLQMIRPFDPVHFLLADVDIEDSPDKSYRGLMLDLARFWHPVDKILDSIDLCWMYRMTTLQLHFCDDQSYTLPSDVLPLLSSEKHYTKEDIELIVNYAHARGVELLPEIEMPGHCTQLQNAYPEIFGSCGVLRASENTFDYLKKLIQETIEMFPYSDKIHIGGDEASLNNWFKDAETLQYMKDNGIDSFQDLYTDYVARAVKMVLDFDKTPVVWEGFASSGNDKIDKRCIVFAWESLYQTAPSLLKAGFKVINASWKPLYIVPPVTYWAPFEIELWNVYKWMNWWTRSEAYHNDIVVAPTEQVIGGQICVWGDRMKNYEDADRALNDELRLIRERISYLAEKTWNANDEEFRAKYVSIQHVYDTAAEFLR